MALFLFHERYKILKVLYSGQLYNCYLANKYGYSTNDYFVINEINNRAVINKYIGEIIDLTVENTNGFVEYFALNSKLYVIFNYNTGETIANKISSEKSVFQNRFLYFKNIMYKLIKYNAVSNFIKSTILFPDNIVLNENNVIFNFRFFDLDKDLTEKNKVYEQIKILMLILFSEKEIDENKALKIIYDKLEKNIYKSIVEVIKDLEFVTEYINKNLIIEHKIMEKKEHYKSYIKKITTMAIIILICIFSYNKWFKNNKVEKSYSDTEFIGTVEVSKIDTEEKSDEKIIIQNEKIQSKNEPTPIVEDEENTQQLTNETQEEYTVHIVSKGEVLTDIVKSSYQDYTEQDLINVIQYNNISNPDILDVGQEIKIPKKK